MSSVGSVKKNDPEQVFSEPIPPSSAVPLWRHLQQSLVLLVVVRISPLFRVRIRLRKLRDQNHSSIVCSCACGAGRPSSPLIIRVAIKSTFVIVVISILTMLTFLLVVAMVVLRYSLNPPAAAKCQSERQKSFSCIHSFSIR